jgi:hypothetical protein
VTTDSELKHGAVRKSTFTIKQIVKPLGDL